jgi:pimeloyl-ACP methyl ester carboxylesterase
VGLTVSYRAGTNGATVVLLPGSGSTRRSVFPHAEALAARGYSVALVDPRGLGESSGRAMAYGWTGEADVRAVLDWLVAQPGVDGSRIGILGLSMGAEQALTAASNDERVAAVVAEGGSERSYEDVRRTLGGLSLALGVPQYRALFGATELLSGVRPPEPLQDLMARFDSRPVLLLNTAHEAPYGQRYVQASNGAAMLWAPASQEHINSLAEQPEEWEKRVIGFFDEALLR